VICRKAGPPSIGTRPINTSRTSWRLYPEATDGDLLIVETPGGTLTADAETHALLDIVEEREGPIPFDQLDGDIAVGRHVVKDLIPEGQLVTIVGEEGVGKSTLAWQIACEVSSSKLVGGTFEVPEPVAPVLIVDVEQTREDAVILRNDMVARGLDGSGVFWLDANGRAFDTIDDQRWLTRYVRALRPRLIILDTATEAVTRAREDESVKPLFILLHRYLKAEAVPAALLLAQPRKRSQEAKGDRGFDDVFGSRVWKGRSSAVLYLQQDRLTVWKQRGGYLRRRWGGTVGQVVRSDTGPTLILGPKSEAEARADRRETILKAVAAAPGVYSKTSLLEGKLGISGHHRPTWGEDVEALVTERLLTRGERSKLFPSDVRPDGL
jgi:AAA domain